MRLDIDARFIPFAIIIWSISLSVLSNNRIFVCIIVLVIAILVKFNNANRLYLLTVLVAILSSFTRTTNIEIPKLSPGIPVMMEVKVVSDTKNSQGQNFGIFRQENSYTVIAKSYRLEEFGIDNGQRINFKAKIKLDFPRFDNEIEFGSRLIVKGKIEKYNFQNIPYSLAVENYSVLKKASIFNKSINKVRQNFLTVSNNVSGNAKQLLPGLILGDTRNQTLALSQDMKNSGLTHLTAVSGGNIAILLLVIIWLSQKLKFTFKYQITIGLITLVFFAFLVRAEPSVIRASMMGAISLLGLFSGTRRHGISALAIAVCIALLIDPYLSSSWGFSLSVFATAGLLLFTRSFVDSITRIFPRIPESLAVLIAVALSAQLSTASLIAAFSGQITLMSIPANLLAAPAIPFVTILGYLTLLFSNLFMPLAKLFGYAAAFFANWIGFLAHFFASQDSSVIRAPKGFWGFILVSFVISLVIGLKKLNSKFNIIDRRIIVIILLTTLFFTFFIKRQGQKNWPGANWQFVMCDVGQGDGLVLRDFTGKVLVVDVGPNGQLMNDCLKKLSVKTIDILILTHFHTDHVEGLELVKNRHNINKIYVTWVEEPINEVNRINQLLQNTETIQIKSGEIITLGDMKIQCLWPSETKMSVGSIPNNASVVNLVTIKNASFLLTGDIEPPAQEAIRRIWQIEQVDVVKVPHHGSRFQDVNFPKWTKARLALISVGAENRYGHPSKLTTDLYRDAGMKVLSTDEVGSIAIGISADDSIQVSTQD